MKFYGHVNIDGRWNTHSHSFPKRFMDKAGIRTYDTPGSRILSNQVKNRAKRSPKSPNSHFYAFGTRRRKCKAEEDVLERQIRLCPEPGALCEENASLEACGEYLFLNVERGIYFRVGMAVVPDFEPALTTLILASRRTMDMITTYKHPSTRNIPANNQLWQKLVKRTHHDVSPARISRLQTLQPIQKPRVAPVLVHQLIHNGLGEATGSLACRFAVADKSFNDLLRGSHPAHSRAGGEDLGKGVETHYAAVSVDAEI